MTYVVLGMHKSGTTLVSEILHRSGIPMVEETSEADYASGNKWERASTLAFDKDLLAAEHVDSLSLAPPDEAALLSEPAIERARRLVERVAAETAGASSTTGASSASGAAETVPAGDAWGFKDPRACLTWPVWRRVLPAPCIIGVYRRPESVVRHFQENAARLHRKSPLWRLRVEWLTLRRWVEHNQRVLAAIEVSDGSSILVSYERLMSDDEELAHLQRFLGRDLVDPRDPEKRRATSTTGLRARLGLHIAGLTGAGAVSETLARLETRREELLASLVPEGARR